MTSRPARDPAVSARAYREVRALGGRLAEASTDPCAFVELLEGGLAALHDAEHPRPLARPAQEPPPDHDVRAPLRRLLRRHLRASLAGMSSSTALDLAALLERNGSREVRLLALPFLEHALDAEPERTWQSLRRLGHGARDWREVEGLAAVWARGVLAEPFRWAELEQLVFSAHPLERRLVGATLARIPHRVPEDAHGRLRGDLGRHVLPTLGMLMGDDDDLVQGSLSRALRAWTAVEAGAVEAFLRDQAAIAEEHRDGHRARVVRDALAGQPEAVSEDLRRRLAGIRRTPGAPASSRAAHLAAAFEPTLAGVAGQVEQGSRYERVRA